MTEEVRRLLKLTAAEAQGEHEATKGIRLSMPAACEDQCPQCSSALAVQKTVDRWGTTLRHGHFLLRERVLACSSRCRSTSGQLTTVRPADLGEFLLPQSVFGYDVMVFVGLARFLEHRQREEIRDALRRDHGITISTGEISHLCRRFLMYLEALQVARAPQLRAAMAADGGWPLHIDTTCEDGQGTLMVIFAGWREWVLAAAKIPTENAEAIGPHIDEVANRYGMPCAAMRDLGPAVILALNDFKKRTGATFQIFSCLFHFLADVGKDLLDRHHSKLRNGLREHKLLGRLRTLARDLGRKLGAEVAEGRAELLVWQQARDSEHRVPEGRAGLSVVRALTQWILDYQADGEREGFPFDQPCLNLYERCHTGLSATAAFLRDPPEDHALCRHLEKLQTILQQVADDNNMTMAASHLQGRVRLFRRVREALRLRKNPRALQEESPGSNLDAEERAVEVRDVRAGVARLLRQLRAERPQRGPAKEQRHAIDIILEHFHRHRRSLWGHEIKLPPEIGGGVRLMARTNNVLESFFHRIKHQERRRSGRKSLTDDLETLPAAAALAKNLSQTDYVEILCGRLEALPQAFATLDHAQRAQGRPPVGREEKTRVETSTASITSADRRAVRTEGMTERVEAAARSRKSGLQRRA